MIKGAGVGGRSLAMDFAEGHRGPHLSAAAISLYGAIARQEWQLVDILDIEKPGARPELLAWELISDEQRPVVRDPNTALQLKMARELDEARKRVSLLAEIPDLTRQLDKEYQAVQLRVAGGTSVYLADPAAVNARIQDVVGGARREILAAQPGGPRAREVLEAAVSRDTAALDRGVELRTLYRDTVRDHALTAEYARTMSARTEGRPAQYRTLVGDFERMIIVDREAAFISDHIVEGSPAHAAWLVTDPAVVAVLVRIFRSKWPDRAGSGHRVRRGRHPYGPPPARHPQVSVRGGVPVVDRPPDGCVEAVTGSGDRRTEGTVGSAHPERAHLPVRPVPGPPHRRQRPRRGRLRGRGRGSGGLTVGRPPGGRVARFYCPLPNVPPGPLVPWACWARADSTAASNSTPSVSSSKPVNPA